ncbi:cytochrome P450 [Saccharopolyspora spinosa]|uniref:Cytochrome P450 n=1 Tax=Saccharopolyspora spinosa TaxID=60894 RepID=Q6JHN9_SACSN|nr:cytochrome P450 [Saccharopolyspora spinosa]AAS00418.1 cytochrome P450 [Saccharopolyspora spinosa NRRL 18395]PKW16138.1 cytochrome P450 [Saccharopolyspora spinosa]
MNIKLMGAGRTLADPAAYANDDRIHKALALLRREAPVHWVEAPGYRPFWAITRHADVMEIERQPDLFRNAPRPILVPDAMEKRTAAQGTNFRTLVSMDGAEHRQVRAIGTDWFGPGALRHLETRVTELARQYVDRMLEFDGECDFVTDIAVHYPLDVILSLLGLPRSDFPRVLSLAKELLGNADQEINGGRGAEGFVAVQQELLTYFNELTAARRATPTTDLASAIANARLDGALLSEFDAASYYILIATAGHDTTSASIAGGLQALIENPQQLRQLQDDLTLLPTAVDEMIRWVTPIKCFLRTATEDYVLRGTTIRKGDSVLLSYPSANRDEDLFEEPFRFDIRRTPNRHLAFGFGVHYCLGAALAKMEARAFFAELLPRLDSVQLAGKAELFATNFIGGLKHLPIRYKLRPSV